MHAIDEIARMMAMDAAAHSGSTAPVDSYTKSETDALLEQKADKSEVTESVTAAVAQIVANAPEDFDTLQEMSDWIASHEDSAAAMNTQILQNAADIDAVETQQTEQSAVIRAAAEDAALNRSTLGYQRKNLLPLTKAPANAVGVSFTVNDGVVTLTGTASAKADKYFPEYDYSPTASKTWVYVTEDSILSCYGTLGGVNIAFYSPNASGALGSMLYGGAKNSKPLLLKKGIIIAGIYVSLLANTNYTGNTLSIMLRDADIADNTFEPYKPSVQEQIEIIKEKKMDKTQIPDLMSLSMKMICPNNSVIPDDSGGVSSMVYIPAFKLKEVLTGYGNKGDELHPAFIVNGQAIPGFYYSKYQNHVNSGVAYSLPAEDPTANITFDTALARCTAKGAGWHLSTSAEWAAIALWCKKNGFMPYGNNNYGRDTRESNYRAIPTTKGTDGRTNHVATGTGPLSWSHDQTPSGIWDLNGNVWEWQGGIRIVWGELQILANNDAADPGNPQNATSTRWKAINASTGELVNPECSTTDTAATTSGNTVRFDYVNGAWVFTTSITSSADSSRNCVFGKVTAAASIGNAAKVMLRALALLPDEGAAEADYEGDQMYLNNGVAERGVLRGGSWGHGAGAGVFSFDGGNARSHSYGSVGFRSAYILNVG